MDTEVASDAWALLLPDLLLDIFRRLETTAVIRCAAACKPWRRGIICNASRLRLCPDRFNPNLLLGFFHRRDQRRSPHPRPRTIVSVTAADTGHCKTLSSLIPAASAGGVDDQSSFPAILSSRDAWLLLRLFRRGSNSNPDELCLCNPITRDCTFLPRPSTMEQQCEYTIVTGHDHGAVRILAKAEKQVLCTAEGRGRLTYQVFSCCGGGSDGAGMWGPVQRSDEVDKRSDGLRMLAYGRNAVVGRDGVHWLTGPQLSGCRVTGTVGLDIDTGRAWATKLPSRCQFFYASTPWCALILTASGDGRLSLLQPLQDGDIKVWALNDAMEWSMQHKIPMDVPKHPPANDTMASQDSNVVCPRSGFLFIMLNGNLQQCINLGSRACQPVQSLGNSGGYHYYPCEMDWSTYISNMKNL